jgi:hypothetical protein
MASSLSVSDWECGACASINKGGIYCPMCAAPRPRCKNVLGTLAGDAVHTAFAQAAVGYPMAVAALPMAVAKKAGTVDGAPAQVVNASKAPAAREAMALKECSLGTVVANTSKVPVATEAKASKECFPATVDVAAPVEVVAAPAPVVKVPGPFHPTGVVVEIIRMEVGDQGCTCEEHSNCGEVMVKDMVVHLWKVQIQVEGGEEMVITA